MSKFLKWFYKLKQIYFEDMEKVTHFDIEKTYMSDRGIFKYFDALNLTEKELDDSNVLILDLGSGAQQNFSKEMHALGFKAKVISVDPRLGLSEDKDIALPNSSKLARLQGRKEAEPLTLAAESRSLPFKDSAFNSIYAMYSVPYYLESPNEVKNCLNEMIRVLRPGGTIRAFPIFDGQELVVREVLDGMQNCKYTLELKSESHECKDFLLVLDKIDIVMNER